MHQELERPVSTCPAGEAFPLPTQKDYQHEFRLLQQLIMAQRGLGREIVVVMGTGYATTVTAGLIADSANSESLRPSKFVINLQYPLRGKYWAVPYLNRGQAPVQSKDPELSHLIDRCVNSKKTLTATFSHEVLTLADIVIVTGKDGANSNAKGMGGNGQGEFGVLEEGFLVIGQKIDPECLVLIETVVPPGTTEYVAYPILKKAFEKRGVFANPDHLDTSDGSPSIDHGASITVPEPLVAHSYERVVTGSDSNESACGLRRICSGVTDAASQRVIRFYSGLFDVDTYPITVLDRPAESETANVVENSYQSTLKTFLQEWSHYSKRNGVDLGKVIEAAEMPFPQHALAFQTR